MRSSRPPLGDRLARFAVVTLGLVFIAVILAGVWVMEVWELVWPRQQ